ncbi:MAG: hypothetical protein IJM14_03140 [Lachnospiraceae bacterium]|nr:hypothetical protein [Lachnospiraceae bacterium]
MKNKIVRLFIAVCMAVVLTTSLVGATSIYEDTWGIRYYSGAPGSVNVLYDILELSYFSAGYEANCTYFTLANGSVCEIISNCSLGISKTVWFTTTGYVTSWTMIGSSSSNVKFRVDPYNTSTGGWASNGSIYLYNYH